MPSLLFARPDGQLLDMPEMAMAGRSGDQYVEPLAEELIPLPEGATLTAVPERLPIGIRRRDGQFAQVAENPFRRKKEQVWAVAALLPQGFTRTLLPAHSRAPEKKPLPLLGYTAVGMDNQGRFVVAARQTDEHHRWNPAYFNTPELEGRVAAKRAAMPGNRLIRQLACCSLEYGCLTAQNVFYGRWEAGVPVSPVCNADCVGCISAQPAECCPSPQRRLDFVPAVAEILEIAVPHLTGAEDGIISFGQGCEGEPSLQGALIAKAIREIRRQTTAGTVNINTNGGDHGQIRAIVDAGLDSMRMSMISPSRGLYHRYHRPRGYTYDDAVRSLSYASAAGVHTALNLLSFPGVTDSEGEVAALVDLVKATGVRQIQLRNLNIDPDLYMAMAGEDLGPALGLDAMLDILADEVPALQIGNYSRPVRRQ